MMFTLSQQPLLGSDLWMRAHYSFVGLRNLVAVLENHSQGLRAVELNGLVRTQGIVRTKKGTAPSPTTLYHYRRALLKLGIVERRGKKLVIAYHDPLVARLVDSLTQESCLTSEERRAFAALVFRNRDCRKHFFDFFMPDHRHYRPVEFAATGSPVVWQEASEGHGRRIQFLRMSGEAIREISTEIEIQAILYGLRYWARDELSLIDEFFREDIGNLMFPIWEPGNVPEHRIRDAILSEVSSEEEWTVLSVRDLVTRWAIQLRVPVKAIFNTVTNLYRAYPGYVALITTPRSLATLTTASWLREDFELRSYPKDEMGRYVSHIRLHRRLRKETTYDRRTGTIGATLQPI